MASHVRTAPSGDTIAEAGSPSMLTTTLLSIRDRLLRQDSRQRRFEQAVLPHLPAAYDLARWLTRNDADAEDVVQTACLRALQFFDGFQGANPRAWLLTIVRNAFYTALERKGRGGEAEEFDEALHTAEGAVTDPELALLKRADSRLLRRAFEELPLPFREVMVLRELEGLSYKEIAAVAGLPLGTVMSRLARARRHLQEFLIAHGVKEKTP